MPNYSLVINSKFRPFEFSEMLQPVLLAEQAHREIEDAYGELATKASIWDKMTNSETDKRAHSIYKNYARDLEQQAEDLAKYGITPSSRQSMIRMKKRYSEDIVPIENAYNTRKAQIEEQRKALLQNPTLLLSRRADTTSLDAYLDNPQLGYDSYSGALLTQQVGQAASAIAKELKDYSNGKKLDGFTRTWLQQHGYTAAEVAKAINNPDDSKSSRILNSIVNNVMADSGVANWASEDVLGQAYNYARQGLWQAVGQTQVQTYTDEAAKLAAQEASQKRVARYAAGLQNPTMNVTPKFDRRNVRTSVEIARDTEDARMLEKYGKYFKRSANGIYTMTAEGQKKYKSTPFKYKGAYSTAFNDAATEFKEWVDRNGLSEMAQGRYGRYQSKLIDNIVNRTKNIYDTSTAGEYTGLIDSSQYDNVIGALNKISKDGKVKSYERTKKGNSYEFIPKEDVDVSSLSNTDIKSATPVYGKHGNFLEVTLKGGQRITIPYNNINSNYNSLVQGNINDALALEILKNKGNETFTYSDGRVVPIDIAITDALNQGFDNFMSGLGTSTVDAQKTSRGLYQMR